jgi:hypothetical protein
LSWVIRTPVAAAAFAQRLGAGAEAHAFLAEGDHRNRHLRLRIDLGGVAAHPHKLIAPFVARVGRLFVRQRDDDIEIAFAQVAQHRRRAAAQCLEIIVRPTGAEFRQRPGQQRAGQIARQANANALAGIVGLAGGQDLVIDRKQAPRMRDDCLALPGECDAGRRAIEQIAAEHPLQPFDLCTDGRLSHTQRLGRLGETAQVHHRDQGAQQIGRNVRHRRHLTSTRSPGGKPFARKLHRRASRV